MSALDVAGGAVIVILVGVLLFIVLRAMARGLIPLVRVTWKVVIVGAIFIAVGLVVAFFLAQFIDGFFAFWPPLATVLKWLAWLFVGFLIPGILAAEVCDDSK